MKPGFSLDVLKKNESLEISFGVFPFWQGVQAAPGVSKTFPFRLIAKPGYPIQQSSGTAVVDQIIDVYQSEEYDFMTPPPGKGNWADELGEGMLRATQRLLATIPALRIRSVLEVGAGTPFMAQRMKSLYPYERYTIIDPSIREISRGEIEIIRGYFPHPHVENRKFDLVMSFNVLEHVPDPKTFLDNLRRATTETGAIVLIFPDCGRQIQSGDLNVLIHEHLNYFTEQSTRSLMAEAGLAVLTLERFNDTFAVLLRPAAQGEVPSLDERNFLEASAATFEATLNATKKVVDETLGRRGTVGFHGATNALNIFLFLTGFGDQPGIRIYDGDNNKAGKYLPSSSIAVRSSADATYAENDVLIISAMSYYDSISRFAVEKRGVSREKIFPMNPRQP